MPGTDNRRDGVRRLADLVAEAIRAQQEDFLRAEGTATLAILKAGEVARIRLSISKFVGVGDVPGGLAPRRLPGEIHQLASDVRRKMLQDEMLVAAARQVVIEIRLRGPRPDVEFIYRT